MNYLINKHLTQDILSISITFYFGFVLIYLFFLLQSTYGFKEDYMIPLFEKLACTKHVNDITTVSEKHCFPMLYKLIDTKKFALLGGEYHPRKVKCCE